MTAPVFVYGTLRHIALLCVVLGRPKSQLTLSQATAPDHRVSRVAGHDFPMIHGDPSAEAPGLLLEELTQADCDALSYYEGNFGYELRMLAVDVNGRRVDAQVFFPDPGLWIPAEPWSLEVWAEAHGRFTVELAHEKMQSRPFMPENGVLHPPFEMMMRQRANARLSAAQRSEQPERDLTRDVIVHKQTRKYAGFFAYDELDLQFRRYDGSLSPVVQRGYLAHTEAVVVLVYDPLRDTVLVVEQFRAPVYGAGDPSPWVWEAVAGLIDPGETPEEAARRETEEEAGVTPTELLPIGPAYSSTGSMTEYLHYFVGLADLSDIGGGGLEEEDEDIRVGVWPFPEALDWVDAGHCKDAPLLVTMLWLARHRDRLRAEP